VTGRQKLPGRGREGGWLADSLQAGTGRQARADRQR
jgi:hypothetical protein